MSLQGWVEHSEQQCRPTPCRVQQALRRQSQRRRIIEAACWAHGRRKFFDLARLSRAPIAAEAVKGFDVLLAIDREINRLAPQGAVARAPRA
jgi:hypothetical protein